jgi:2-amino-4-hydroxy-6-hydroxymethyldihydropteridine diphosphokinase
MANVYVGVGSNLGDRQANIDRAIQLLKENEDVEVVAVSSLIESAPEGGQGGDYLNGAIHLKTELLPPDLLSQLKTVERRLGRQKAAPNAPRPLDLDILFYDDVVIVDGKTLSIPHPRMEKRVFVLKPLCEIAPELVHPRSGKTVRALLDELAHDPTTSSHRS